MNRTRVVRFNVLGQESKMKIRRVNARLGVPALLGALAAVIVTTAPAAWAEGSPIISSTGPAAIIYSLAHTLLTDIDAHRSQYRANPGKLNDLASKVLLPHFDVNLAARLVLARHWDNASAEQRQRFTYVFYHSLLQNYSAELLDINLASLQVLNYERDPGSSYGTVNTLVQRGNGNRVHVDYSLHRTQQGWKIYDFTIEGISYVTSFREDFGEEIEQKGLNALISRLQSEYDVTSKKG